VRLARQDGLEEYVVLAWGVFLGSDPSCAVQLHKTVGDLHARLVWSAGSFWLEPCLAEPPTLAAGRPVPAGARVPLRPGLALQLGGARLTVAGFQQAHVDYLPAV
jgi:hypothetical protein